jgi:hypothetical protein
MAEMNPADSAISELAAALQTDHIPEGPDTPEGLRAALAQPERAPVPPGGTVVGWLASLYRSGNPEFQARLRESLVGLLEAPESFGLRGEPLALALGLAEEARIPEAGGPIRALVKSRKLAALSDDCYSDLHGRALRALLALGGLDPVACFEQELPYRDYVPLAFAFVRDRAKDKLPEVLAQISLSDFFADALETIVLTYPDDYMELLHRAVQETLAMDDAGRVAAFVAAAQRLTVRPTELEKLLQELRPEEVPAIEVFIAMEDEHVDQQIISVLREAEFEAKKYSSTHEVRRANAPWIVASGKYRRSDFPLIDFRGRTIKFLEVHSQGDPHASTSELSLIIPRFVQTPDGQAEHIRQRLIQLRLQERQAQKTKAAGDGPRAPYARGVPAEELDLVNQQKPVRRGRMEVIGAPSR